MMYMGTRMRGATRPDQIPPFQFYLSLFHLELNILALNTNPLPLIFNLYFLTLNA